MRILLAALTLLALAGCGGGGASTPDGYETYQAPRASFAHPPGWKVLAGPNNWVASSPEDPGSQVSLTIADIPDEATRKQIVREAELQEKALSRRGELEDYDIGLDDADEAVGYRLTTDRSTMIAYWAVVDDGRTVVRLVVDGPEDALDADGVAESLQLKD